MNLSGIKNYLFSWNNTSNLMLYILLSTSYGLKIYTIINTSIQLATIETTQFWSKLTSLTPDDEESQINVYQTFYWLNEGKNFFLFNTHFEINYLKNSLKKDRFYWFSFDPINLSEALFSVSLIVGFVKICFYFQASQTLGPLQISLGRMLSVRIYAPINDDFKMLFISCN